MSFVFGVPGALSAAATELARMRTALAEAVAAAAANTTGLLPAAADEVSERIAALLDSSAREFQAVSAQATAYHDRFAQTLESGAQAYLGAETTNALRTAGSSTVALIMAGSGNPIPPPDYVDGVDKLFIQPNFPGALRNPLFTPEGFYPVTGFKSLPLNTSISQGVEIVLSSIAQQIEAGHNVVVLGASQSAMISSLVMQQLAAGGATAGNLPLSFVLLGNPMNPNGGMWARFAGLTLPSLGWDFYGATPADLFHTVSYTLEYDGVADYPRYPLNILADINALFGFATVHGTYPDLTPAQLASAVLLPGSHSLGATNSLTDYYMIPTTNLPLLAPLRAIPLLGNPIADLLQPDLRYLVNMGYGDPLYGYSTGPADVHTPFGVLPPLESFQKLPGLLVAGAGQGIGDFVGDFTGRGPNPVVWPELGSAVGAGGALPVTLLTGLSGLAANPATYLTQGANALANAASAAYGGLQPTADMATAALISIPAYDASLFLTNLGDPVTAIGLPIAANVGLGVFLTGIESLVALSSFALAVSALVAPGP